MPKSWLLWKLLWESQYEWWGGPSSYSKRYIWSSLWAPDWKWCGQQTPFVGFYFSRLQRLFPHWSSAEWEWYCVEREQVEDVIINCTSRSTDYWQVRYHADGEPDQLSDISFRFIVQPVESLGMLCDIVMQLLLKYLCAVVNTVRDCEYYYHVGSIVL